MALRLSYVQTKIVAFITNSVEETAGVKVKIGKFDFNPITSLNLYDVYIEDLNKDTMVYCSSVDIKFDSIQFLSRKLKLSNITFKDSYFYLYSEKIDKDGNSYLNIERFINSLIASYTKKTKSSQLPTTKKFETKVYKEASPKFPWKIRFGDVHMINSRFTYKEAIQDSVVYGVNWTNIVCSKLNFDISNILFRDEFTRLKVSNLSLVEKSGLNIKHISGDVVLRHGIMDVNDFNLILEKSRVNLSTFQFSWPSDEHAWRYFTSKVMQFYNISSASISFEDLAYFNDVLLGIKTRMECKGMLYGTINNFKGRNLNVKIADKSTLKFKFNSWGLPDTFGTIFDIDIQDANLNPDDIASVYLPWFDMNIPVPNALKELDFVHFNNLTFDGLLENFILNAETDSPELTSELHMDYSPDSLRPLKQSNFKGKYLCTAVDFGTLFKLNNLSYAYGNTIFSGTVEEENISFKTSGIINSLQFNQGMINKLSFDYSLDHNNWKAKCSIKDNGFQFDIGLHTRSLYGREYILGNGKLSIEDIEKFSFISDGYDGDLVTDYNFSFSNDFRDVYFNIDSLYYKNERGDFHLNKIDFAGTNFGEDSCRILFNSDFLRADIKGDLSKLKYDRFFGVLASNYIPSYFSSSVGINDENWSCQLKLLNVNKLLKVIYPDLYISNNASLNVIYDKDANNLEGFLYADTLRYKDFNLNGSRVDLFGDGHSLNSAIRISKLSYKDFVLHNVLDKSLVKSDSLENNLSWANSDNETYCGNIDMKFDFYKENGNNAVNIDLLPGVVIIGDSIWNLERANISVVGREVTTSNMSFSSKNKYFMLKGGVSQNNLRSLDFYVNQISIEGINKLSFTEKIHDFDLTGFLTGRASVYSVYAKRKVVSNFLLKDWGVNGDYFGNLKFISSMESKDELMRIVAENKIGEFRPVSVGGVYDVNNDSLNVKLNLRNLNIYKLRKYIGEYVSKTHGNITGELNFKGNILQPRINGYIYLDSVNVMINALQNHFFVNDRLYVSNDNIYLKDFLIKDSNNGSMTCSGSYNVWKNVYNLDFALNNFYVMNTNLVDNDRFYGKLFLSGKTNISSKDGDFVNLTSELITEKNSKLYLPMSSSSENVNASFVNFIGNSIKEENNSLIYNRNKLGVDVNIDLNDNLSVQVVFNPLSGDILRVKGNGNVHVGLDKSGRLNMLGQYNVEDGNYFFTLGNIWNKKFVLKPGGSIIWNGSPYDATLDVKAAYRVKTSVNELLAGSSGFEGENNTEAYRKIPVECILNLTDKLTNPLVKFDINFPSLESRTKNYIQSMFSSQEDINKQAVSLIVMNRFYQTDQINSSLGEQASVAGVTSLTEMVTNQLSKWLSRISNKFDVGLVYHLGDKITSDEVEVALSTQFLKDRVSLSINGNMNVRSNATNTGNSAGSNIVGDFDLGVKLNSKGSLNLKAYSHTDERIIYNNNETIQGVGVSYKESFNSFKELLRKYFPFLYKSKNNSPSPKLK